MDSLPFKPQDEWLKLLYASRLSKYSHNIDEKFAKLESAEIGLAQNLEVVSL